MKMVVVCLSNFIKPNSIRKMKDEVIEIRKNLFTRINIILILQKKTKLLMKIIQKEYLLLGKMDT